MSDDLSRIDSIEWKLAYLEKNTDELNSILVGFEKRLEKLEAISKQTVDRVRELSLDKDNPMPGNVKPPHY